MTYPVGLKIFIDGEDCTYYIFGKNTFSPIEGDNVLRDINITPYLRLPDNLTGDRKYRDTNKGANVHTIEITAEDGNGRVECRVEVR
jgi:hypothetical protein